MISYLLALNIVGGFHKLAWAQRLSYALFIYAVVINTWASRQSAIDRPWRKLYGFKACIAFLAWLYYTLLVTETISSQSYTSLARWLQPLIVVCLFTSAQLHRWEIGTLRQRKELEHKLKLLTERDD